MDAPDSAPLFGSTRDALRFALNVSAVAPTSFMNKSMADGVRGQEATEDMRPSTHRRRRRTTPLPVGLAGVAQAAMIAKQLDHLPERQRDCIIAMYSNSTTPCSCRRPCCCGHRRNEVWDAAVNRICADIQYYIATTKTPGKRGVQEHPRLRYALVRRFFQPRGKVALDQIAADCEVSPQTVISHKKVIETWCNVNIKDALGILDEVLSTSGIVGQLD